MSVYADLHVKKPHKHRDFTSPHLHGFFTIVPAVGLEPTRPLGQQILSLPRLPFRHAGIQYLPAGYCICRQIIIHF